MNGTDACAKIVTEQHREFYLEEGVTEVILGREKKMAREYFQIGDSNTISKQHAKVFSIDMKHLA